MESICQALMEGNNIALLTHRNPDGDTLGCALGVHHALRAMGKNSWVVSSGGVIPRELDFLEGSDKIKTAIPAKCALAIAFDTGSFELLEVERGAWRLINIDHHPDNARYGDLNLIDPAYASCTALVYKLLRCCEAPIKPSTATALYTGLVTDSGFFGYDHVDAELFRIAAELVELGANPAEVYQNLTQRTSLARYRLQHHSMATLELHGDAKIGCVMIDRAMLERCGASSQDVQNLANEPLRLVTVEVAVLLVEEGVNYVRISLRSKNDVAVNAVAQVFGGGGHAKAAGARVTLSADETMEDCKKRVIQKLKETMDET